MYTKSTPCVLAILAVLALLVGGCTAIQAAPLPQDETEATPIILVSDVATGLVGGWRTTTSDIDDGWAVGMAVADPTLDLRGVVVTFGNGLVDPEVVVAEKIVRDLLDEPEIPVVRGAAEALSTEQTFWYDGTPLNPACINDGVTFMAEQLRDAEQPITLVGIGPLTDVACLVQNFPEDAAQAAGLIVLMGREPHQEFRIGDTTGLTDFNHVMDEQAIGIILANSAIPVTYMTFPLTSSALVPQDRVDAYAEDERALAGFFYASAINWIDQWQSWGFDEDGFHPWDNNPVFYAAHPDAFQCQEVDAAMVVQCAGSPNHDSDDNLCAGHGPDQPSGLDKEGSQLWLGNESVCATDDETCQDQVTEYRGGTICTAYADDAAQAGFIDAIFEFLGAPQ